jgi:hypothetical protein
MGRVGRLALLCGVALGGPGCLSSFHAVELPAPELLEPCRCLPQCCRGHVHVFLIDGIDPLDAGDMGAVRTYLIGLGFNKTSLGQVYHAGTFGAQVRKIHQECPDARFVLVGFDRGARAARSLACQLAQDGVPPALVVFLDGQFLEELPPGLLPDTRVVHVRNAAGMWDVPELRSAENVNLRDCGHFQLPTHPATLEVLAHELTAVALTVPVPACPAEVLPPRFEPAPPPRPVEDAQALAGPPAGWDFLRSATASPAPAAAPTPPAPTEGAAAAERRAQR